MSAESLLITFERLRLRWKIDTQLVSSSSALVKHPAYRQIIELGPEVVPLILTDLEREPDHWHMALVELTGENPVPASAHGRLRAVADAWTRWGRQKGLLPSSGSTGGGT